MAASTERMQASHEPAKAIDQSKPGIFHNVESQTAEGHIEQAAMDEYVSLLVREASGEGLSGAEVETLTRLSTAMYPMTEAECPHCRRTVPLPNVGDRVASDRRAIASYQEAEAKVPDALESWQDAVEQYKGAKCSLDEAMAKGAYPTHLVEALRVKGLAVSMARSSLDRAPMAAAPLPGSRMRPLWEAFRRLCDRDAPKRR